MSNQLTKKERGFVKDMLKTGNGVQSALKNYDTEDYSTAGVIAHENLRKPKIQKALQPAVERYRKELDAILSAMELKDKNSEQYKTLVEAANIIQKQLQLLTGGATENIAVKPLATLEELRGNNIETNGESN